MSYKITRISDDSLMVISQANENEGDLDSIDEALWEKYLEDCSNTGVRPTYSDFIIWRTEKG